jgi:hypothetical protein
VQPVAGPAPRRAAPAGSGSGNRRGNRNRHAGRRRRAELLALLSAAVTAREQRKNDK